MKLGIFLAENTDECSWCMADEASCSVKTDKCGAGSHWLHKTFTIIGFWGNNVKGEEKKGKKRFRRGPPW